MIEVSKRMKKTLLIVNNFRWDYLNPSIFQLKSMIDSGWFGRIYHIRLNRIRSKTFPFNDYSRWNLDSRLSGGGVLIDLGPHMIDLGMWLASEYRVNAVLGSTDQGLLKLEKIDDNKTLFIWEETLKFPIYLGSIVGEFFGAPVLKLIWKRNLKNLKEEIWNFLNTI